MNAITISRTLGSYGGPIAEQVALELGWKFADRFFINEVISQYGLIRLPDLYDKPPSLADLFNDNTRQTIEWMDKTAVALAAQHDTVILGRGGFATLKGYADVFNVFVTAPLEERIRRVSVDEKLSQEEATERAQQDADTKTRFVRRYYGANWADEDSYDLVVDSAELSRDQAVRRIIEAAQVWFAESDGPKVADLDVDVVLAETIEQQFAAADLR